jgi:hypothetical protein
LTVIADTVAQCAHVVDQEVRKGIEGEVARNAVERIRRCYERGANVAVAATDGGEQRIATIDRNQVAEVSWRWGQGLHEGQEFCNIVLDLRAIAGTTSYRIIRALRYPGKQLWRNGFGQVVATLRHGDTVRSRLNGKSGDGNAVDTALRSDGHFVEVGVRGELNQVSNRGFPAKARDAR